MGEYVELLKLGKTYDTSEGPSVVVEDFTLNLARGEFVSLLGQHGCGKSTVLTMVAGLTPITRGGVAIASREVDGPGPDRATVLKNPCLMPWMTIFENVMLGVQQVYPHGTEGQRDEVVSHYLELVGLGNSHHKRAGDLSRGMQQRVEIAKAFALKPRMLLLDEPFDALDALTRLELQEVLLNVLNQDDVTTLMITHDVDEALFMSDRIVMMTNGPKAKVDTIFQLPFERPRLRSQVLKHENYHQFRGKMTSFLLTQSEQVKPDSAPANVSN